MSFGIDVNLLLYATDRTSPLHAKATGFLQDIVAGNEVFCIAWVTAMSYLRIATHPSIFAKPLSPAEARGNLTALLNVAHCRTLAEEEGFWEVYGQVTSGLSVRGNLVPDAHLAAVLRQHGVTRLYTHDKDFRKFDFLKVIDPLL